MCHNSVLENEQIEKCIESGMPEKIIKTIKYTMRKRVANSNKNEVLNNKQQQQQEKITKENQQQQQLNTEFSQTPTKVQEQQQPQQQQQAFISKCPFGYGKLPTPSLPRTTAAVFPAANINLTNDFDLSFKNTNNNNNNVVSYENFLQISQLSTKITERNFKDSSINSTTTETMNPITNLSGHYSKGNEIYNDDILAKSTQLTREFASIMQQAIRRLQNSKTYILLTKTTQAAHLVAIATVTIVLLSIWPELIYGTSDANQSQQYTATRQKQYGKEEQVFEMSSKRNDMLALIAYLGAFSTHFGAQIWMTFVSGLSLYFSLPRHMFGQCQQILFPKYFAMNAVLSITMLILYVKFFLNTWTLAKCIQLGSLALTGAIEVLVRLYLAPPLLRLMHEKYKIEGTIGSGEEIGSLVQGDLVKCPHYQRIHKAFRRTHMTVAIGNMITMAASCLHLYYIAGQLQISIVH